MYTAPRRRETGREGSGVGRKVARFGESTWLVTVGEVSERMVTEGKYVNYCKTVFKLIEK
jgi:hypothetical protein